MTARRIGYLSLFIALSVIGGFIKIPSPVGSIALDSFPALIAAVLLGRHSGGIVASIGHLMSAIFGGFLLGPFHIMLAIEMYFVVWLFGTLYEKSRPSLAYLSFIIMNALIAPLPFILIMDWAFYLGLLPFLLLATIINTLIAAVLTPRFKPFFNQKLQSGAL